MAKNLVPGGPVTDSDPDALTTARLLVRPPREADRSRFIELFCDADFMVYYPGRLTREQASDRFDHMLAVCATLSFGKQPVVELSSGSIVATPASTTSTSRAAPGWNGATGWRGRAAAAGTRPRPAGPCCPGPARPMPVSCWRSSPRRTWPPRTSAGNSDSPSGSRRPWKATCATSTACRSEKPQRQATS
jgi:hypothetical protein